MQERVVMQDPALQGPNVVADRLGPDHAPRQHAAQEEAILYRAANAPRLRIVGAYLRRGGLGGDALRQRDLRSRNTFLKPSNFLLEPRFKRPNLREVYWSAWTAGLFTEIVR